MMLGDSEWGEMKEGQRLGALPGQIWFQRIYVYSTSIYILLSFFSLHCSVHIRINWLSFLYLLPCLLARPPRPAPTARLPIQGLTTRNIVQIVYLSNSLQLLGCVEFAIDTIFGMLVAC